MRFSADASVRRVGDRTLLGGSPLRLFTLSAAGSDLADRALSGEAIDGASAAQRRLLDRLVDSGAIHPDVDDTDASAEVTAVIPVRDRADGLERLLGSLASVDDADRPASIIVVDDGSIDTGSVTGVADRYGATVVRREVSSGPASARNRGAMVATTRFVAFVDSDTVVTPGWLTRSMGHFADDRVGIVAVRVQAPSPEPGAGVLGAFESSRSPLDLGDEPGRVAPRTRIAYVPAAGLLVRTSALRDLDGFDDSLIVGEDVDLVWRADDRGWRVRYEPAARIVHDVRPTMRAWVRQRFDYGTSAAVLDERHPGSVAPVSASPWSLGAWAAVGLGHPVAGGMVALGSAAALPRRLPGVPASEALRLALAGHVGAGRLLARSVVRVWWPVALGASLVSRRARGLTVAAATVSAIDAAVAASRHGDRRPVALAALSIVDDVAYGAGVWAGCVRHRSFRAILPAVTRSPVRSAPRSGRRRPRSVMRNARWNVHSASQNG